MLLLYGAQATSADEEQARVEEYSAWAAEQAAAGRLIAAERLGEVTSVLGAAPAGAAPGAEPAGFFLIRAASAEAAAAIASDCPHLRYGGSVVVRRVGN